MPHGDLDKLAYYYGRNLADHLAASGHNLAGGLPPFLERALAYDGLSPGSIAVLRGEADRMGMAMLVELNRMAADLADGDAGRDDARHRFTAGLYLYDEGEALSVPTGPAGPGADPDRDPATGGGGGRIVTRRSARSLLFTLMLVATGCAPTWNAGPDDKAADRGIGGTGIAITDRGDWRHRHRRHRNRLRQRLGERAAGRSAADHPGADRRQAGGSRRYPDRAYRGHDGRCRRTDGLDGADPGRALRGGRPGGAGGRRHIRRGCSGGRRGDGPAHRRRRCGRAQGVQPRDAGSPSPACAVPTA